MASLPFQAKLGVPLREETEHHTSDSANVNSPRYRIVKNHYISDAVHGQEPWGRMKKKCHVVYVALSRERGHIVQDKRRVNAALCEKTMPGEASPLP